MASSEAQPPRAVTSWIGMPICSKCDAAEARNACAEAATPVNRRETRRRTREGVADAIGRKEGVKTGKRGASASGVLAAEAAARVREERRRRATAGDHDSPTAWKSFLMNPFLSI